MIKGLILILLILFLATEPAKADSITFNSGNVALEYRNNNLSKNETLIWSYEGSCQTTVQTFPISTNLQECITHLEDFNSQELAGKTDFLDKISNSQTCDIPNWEPLFKELYKAINITGGVFASLKIVKRVFEGDS